MRSELPATLEARHLAQFLVPPPSLLTVLEELLQKGGTSPGMVGAGCSPCFGVRFWNWRALPVAVAFVTYLPATRGFCRVQQEPGQGMVVQSGTCPCEQWCPCVFFAVPGLVEEPRQGSTWRCDIPMSMPLCVTRCLQFQDPGASSGDTPWHLGFLENKFPQLPVTALLGVPGGASFCLS